MKYTNDEIEEARDNDRLEQRIVALETRITDLEDELSGWRCFLEDVGIVEGQRMPWTYNRRR